MMRVESETNMREFTRYQIIDKIQDIIDSKNSGYGELEIDYYKIIIKYLKIEELFQEEVNQAGKRLYYHFRYNSPMINRDYFMFIYNPYSPIRFAVETFDSIEPIRIYITKNNI